MSIPWDPMSWGAVYNTHSAWLSNTQSLMLPRRLHRYAPPQTPLSRYVRTHWNSMVDCVSLSVPSNQFAVILHLWALARTCLHVSPLCTCSQIGALPILCLSAVAQSFTESHHVHRAECITAPGSCIQGGEWCLLGCRLDEGAEPVDDMHSDSHPGSHLGSPAELTEELTADMRSAVDFARAAYGYAFLSGGLSSIARYLHMQVPLPLTSLCILIKPHVEPLWHPTEICISILLEIDNKIIFGILLEWRCSSGPPNSTVRR
jgi:hypothetical protein